MSDPSTGYLVPDRDGSGLVPDWESSWETAAGVAAVPWKLSGFDDVS